MANYETLKSAITAVIKQNGNNEITGQLLQQSLLSMINSLGVGFQFAGIATPSTNPGTPDQCVFYIAGPGTYPNFGATIIRKGNIGIFAYGSQWTYSVFPLGITQRLAYPADLNDVVEFGFYSMAGNSGGTRYANVPADYGEYAGFLIVAASDYDANFPYQILIRQDVSRFYIRTTNGSNWGEWQTFQYFVPNLLKNYFDLTTDLPYPTDLNNVTRGIYDLKNYTAERYQNVPSDWSGAGLFMVLYADGYADYSLQILINFDLNRIYYRRKDGTNWVDWVKWPRQPENIDVNDIIRKQNLTAIFQSIGVIGDSLASGQGRVNDGSHFRDFYDYSWPQYLKKQLQNEVYNFTQSGLTTRSWLTSAMGYPLMSDGQHKCQSYIIALGANDIGLTDYLGTPADINLSDYTQNADTYYGNYARIISLCKVQEPRARIFVVTNPCYGSESLRHDFNVAVRYMATIFDNVYLVDLAANESYFNTGFIEANKYHSHYTPAVYKLVATYIEQEISKIIVANPSDFYFVDLIGTEYNDPE